MDRIVGAFCGSISSTLEPLLFLVLSSLRGHGNFRVLAQQNRHYKMGGGATGKCPDATPGTGSDYRCSTRRRAERADWNERASFDIHAGKIYI